jgi:hypothetical protein
MPVALTTQGIQFSDNTVFTTTNFFATPGFLTVGTTIVAGGQINAGGAIVSGQGSTDARSTGFKVSAAVSTGTNAFAPNNLAKSNDIGWTRRSTVSYDDQSGNCGGYLPGNCFGNPYYRPPNGNWWTWGCAGVPTGNCANPSGFDFAGGAPSAFYAIGNPNQFIYSGYSTLYDEIGGAENHRNYYNCNCNSGYGSVYNCYNNCNCNCDCNCNC